MIDGPKCKGYVESGVYGARKSYAEEDIESIVGLK